MVRYEYYCSNCKCVFDEWFLIGQAKKKINCPKCQKPAYRTYNYGGFILKGPGDHWPSQQLKRKQQMTKNNIEAGNRGRKKWKERMPKLVEQ